MRKKGRCTVRLGRETDCVGVLWAKLDVKRRNRGNSRKDSTSQAIGRAEDSTVVRMCSMGWREKEAGKAVIT